MFEKLNYACMKVRQSQQQFGGLQIIASGCFKQLSPVPSYYYDDPGDFCFLSPGFQSTFPHHIHLEIVSMHASYTILSEHLFKIWVDYDIFAYK